MPVVFQIAPQKWGQNFWLPMAVGCTIGQKSLSPLPHISKWDQPKEASAQKEILFFTFHMLVFCFITKLQYASKITNSRDLCPSLIMSIL